MDVSIIMSLVFPLMAFTPMSSVGTNAVGYFFAAISSLTLDQYWGAIVREAVTILAFDIGCEASVSCWSVSDLSSNGGHLG